MSPTVTAVVVVARGGDEVDATLAAIAAQTRRPDTLIAVDGTADAALPGRLADAGASHVVSARERLPFGSAVALGLSAAAVDAGDDRLYWLLDQDTVPEPAALESLLAALEVSPSVGVAGPKLVARDDPSRLRGLGETVTTLGATMHLVEDELDQGQHDHRSDVLGVASAGILVRSALWERLGGFDPALPVVDDGLDLCIRARLAGFRVITVPAARVAVGGVPGAGTTRAASAGPRRMFRLRRTAQLHRRMAYAPALLLVVHWLSLVPLAVARSIIRLLRKQPGAIGGELAAAFVVAFAWLRTARARRTVRRAKSVGFSAIAPLRMRLADARRMRLMARESARARSGRSRTELRFFAGGGVWAVVAMGIVGVAVSIPLLGSTVLGGGGLLPIGSHVGALWANTGYGWRDVGGGFVGPADPFSAVLALLGSATFWNPSLSLVLVWVLAMPIAALGGWLAAARLTERTALRVAAAVLWAIAPPLLTGLQTGRPAAVLLHLVLPWIVFAGARAVRSWAAAATTSLLVAGALACAPSLWPAFALAWLVSLAVAWRRAGRLAAVPLPAAVLFLPLAVRQAVHGHPLAVFADPGAPIASPSVPMSHLLLGFPSENLAGWSQLAARLGLDRLDPMVLVTAALAPLVVLALAGGFLRSSRRTALWIGLALAGTATAVAAHGIQITTLGPDAVALFAGPGLSLFWLGLVGALVTGLDAAGRLGTGRAVMHRTASTLAWVATVAVAVAAMPAAIALPLGTSHVNAHGAAALPAVVSAQAQTHPRIGTLRLTAQVDGGLAARLVRGAGDTLERQSTIAQTANADAAADRVIARLAGNLASRSGMDVAPELRRLGIGFVLLTPPQHRFGADPSAAAEATDARASAGLAGTSAIQPVASTGYGTLFSFDAGDVAVPAGARIPAHPGGILRPAVFTMLAVVFGAYLLLALPTGRWAEVQETRGRRRPRRRPSARRESRPDGPGDESGRNTGDESGRNTADERPEEAAPSGQESPSGQASPPAAATGDPEPVTEGGGHAE